MAYLNMLKVNWAPTLVALDSRKSNRQIFVQAAAAKLVLTEQFFLLTFMYTLRCNRQSAVNMQVNCGSLTC